MIVYLPIQARYFNNANRLIYITMYNNSTTNVYFTEEECVINKK